MASAAQPLKRKPFAHRKASLRRALLQWYDAHARDLPWRRTRDSYAIWVSEVMLQQTQVAVVLPYWERFLQRFPTLAELAAAPLEDVLAAWRGLGYYARARNLHRAARVVVELHRGALPESVQALSELPGFGRYTVGAVASIAFGRPVPVVDGNVARVLSRLFAVGGAPGELQRERELWRLATHLVAGGRPGTWNQALMELGATVCRPALPSCLLCPLRTHCRALAEGLVERLPPPRRPTPRRRLRLALAVVHRRGRLLLGRRPEHGLFGGLWELPAVEVPLAAEPSTLRAALAAALGRGTRVGEPLGEVYRTLTHRALRLSLYRVEPGPRPRRGGYAELRWVTPDAGAGLGISTAMRAALAHAADALGSSTLGPKRDEPAGPQAQHGKPRLARSGRSRRSRAAPGHLLLT